MFGAAAAEFVLWPKFGTSTYSCWRCSRWRFLSGSALRARRGTQLASGPAVSGRGVRKAGTAAPAPEPEPQFDPAAAQVAESVPLDRAEPKIVHPEVAPNAPSPEVSSPGLQPGDGSHPSPDAPR